MGVWDGVEYTTLVLVDNPKYEHTTQTTNTTHTTQTTNTTQTIQTTRYTHTHTRYI